MTLTIKRGTEFMLLHDDGSISRPAIGMAASGAWRITGAVTRNNFGLVIRHYTLADILEGVQIPWKFANGKQHTFVQDIDHGTHREWICNHSIDRPRINLPICKPGDGPDVVCTPF